MAYVNPAYNMNLGVWAPKGKPMALPICPDQAFFLAACGHVR